MPGTQHCCFHVASRCGVITGVALFRSLVTVGLDTLPFVETKPHDRYGYGLFLYSTELIFHGCARGVCAVFILLCFSLFFLGTLLCSICTGWWFFRHGSHSCGGCCCGCGCCWSLWLRDDDWIEFVFFIVRAGGLLVFSWSLCGTAGLFVRLSLPFLKISFSLMPFLCGAARLVVVFSPSIGAESICGIYLWALSQQSEWRFFR